MRKAMTGISGIAAVPIMQELHLGPRQFGLVGSSFSYRDRSRWPITVSV
jgi:hypothetical protein